jgi:hypothetical protein
MYTILPTVGIRFLQLECHWFYNGNFREQIGIIFSSLVVAPLPDKSDTFVSSGAKPSTELDWLFSSIDISLSYCVRCGIIQISLGSSMLLVLASPPLKRIADKPG